MFHRDLSNVLLSAFTLEQPKDILNFDVLEFEIKTDTNVVKHITLSSIWLLASQTFLSLRQGC